MMSAATSRNHFRTVISAVIGLFALPSVGMASGPWGMPSNTFHWPVAFSNSEHSVLWAPKGSLREQGMDVAVIRQGTFLPQVAEATSRAALRNLLLRVVSTADLAENQELHEGMKAKGLTAARLQPYAYMMGDENDAFFLYDGDATVAHYAPVASGLGALVGKNIQPPIVWAIGEWTRTEADFRAISDAIEADSPNNRQPLLFGEEEGVFVRNEAEPGTGHHAQHEDYVAAAKSLMKSGSLNAPSHDSYLDLAGEEEGVFVRYQQAPEPLRLGAKTFAEALLASAAVDALSRGTWRRSWGDH